MLMRGGIVESKALMFGVLDQIIGWDAYLRLLLHLRGSRSAMDFQQ